MSASGVVVRVCCRTYLARRKDHVGVLMLGTKTERETLGEGKSLVEREEEEEEETSLEEQVEEGRVLEKQVKEDTADSSSRWTTNSDPRMAEAKAEIWVPDYCASSWKQKHCPKVTAVMV